MPNKPEIFLVTDVGLMIDRMFVLSPWPTFHLAHVLSPVHVRTEDHMVALANSVIVGEYSANRTNY